MAADPVAMRPLPPVDAVLHLIDGSSSASSNSSGAGPWSDPSALPTPGSAGVGATSLSRPSTPEGEAPIMGDGGEVAGARAEAGAEPTPPTPPVPAPNPGTTFDIGSIEVPGVGPTPTSAPTSPGLMPTPAPGPAAGAGPRAQAGANAASPASASPLASSLIASFTVIARGSHPVVAPTVSTMLVSAGVAEARHTVRQRPLAPPAAPKAITSESEPWLHWPVPYDRARDMYVEPLLTSPLPVSLLCMCWY